VSGKTGAPPAPPPRTGKGAGATSPAQDSKSSRMTLDSIITGRHHEPDRILLYGTEGVGKSTVGAASGGIFIASEDGIGHLDVPKFPTPETFDEVLDCLRVLYTNETSYPAVVIDTLDWVEHLIHEQGRKESGLSLDKWNAYGQGVKIAMDYHRRFLAALSQLRAKRNMEILLIAHAAVKDFKNPAGADYMRFQPNLAGSTTNEIYKQWVDSVLFANFEEFVKEGEGIERNKGVSTGNRLLFSERCAAWDAKSRWGIPSEIPLSYESYVEARREAGIYIGKESDGE